MKNAELFDDYLNELLDSDKKKSFELELENNSVFAKAFEEHKKTIELLSTANSRNTLRSKLNAIHKQELGENTKVISIALPTTFAQRYGRTITVAAATAFIAVLSTILLLSSGGYLLTNQSEQMKELGKTLNDVKATTDGIVEGITRSRKPLKYAPANLQGSAFALNNQGFVVTSYHIIKNADSVFIQNAGTERTHARLIVSNPSLDIAILKVENEAAIKNWQVPFSLKDKSGEVGEKVFTLGYPREDMVYGEGSLSSLSGYSNDSSMYQISIPVNPGNSGGPLLDENGNIIGVVRGKITGAEATGFAVKAVEISKVIDTAPDSTKSLFNLQKSKKRSLRNIKRTEQIKLINPYVFNVLVYKKD